MRIFLLFCGLFVLIPTTTLAAPPTLPPENVTETWDAVYLLGAKIGHSHTLIDRVEVNGQMVIHVEMESVLAIKRFTDELSLKQKVDSYELEDGTLYAINSVTQMSNNEQKTAGRLTDDGKFQLTVLTPGKREEQTIDWPTGVLGPYGSQRILNVDPPTGDQIRSFKMFLPDMNVVVDTTLSAKGKHTTNQFDGTPKEFSLYEQNVTSLGMKMSLWTDEQGEVTKTSMSMAGMPIISYRVDRATALGAEKPTESTPDIDLGIQTLVKVDKPIPNALSRSPIDYKLTLDDEDAAKTIPESTAQKIVKRDGKVVYLENSKQAPPPGSAIDPAVADEFRDSNGFIQSDDPLIVSTAKQIVGDTTDPWEKAKMLERWVDQNMSNQDFTIGFATASEVMRTRQGDCTEHAVLLAALCRAVGIPSRVAIGLVYIGSEQAFGYHMWTEVNIGGKWYDLDGTLGQGGIAGGHIKLSDASLKGASAMSTLLPVFKILGKLNIAEEAVGQ